jgi:hypothetical protein
VTLRSGKNVIEMTMPPPSQMPPPGSLWKVVHEDGGLLRSSVELTSAEVLVLPGGSEVRILQTVADFGGLTRVQVEGGGATGWLTVTLRSGKNVIEMAMPLPSEMPPPNQPFLMPPQQFGVPPQQQQFAPVMSQTNQSGGAAPPLQLDAHEGQVLVNVPIYGGGGTVMTECVP